MCVECGLLLFVVGCVGVVYSRCCAEYLLLFADVRCSLFVGVCGSLLLVVAV